jgi:hypothetical protein
MNPRVVTVKPNDDFTLTISFTNGEVRVFDMKPHLGLGVFQELRDLSYFKAVRPAWGTIQWPHEQDVCPDTLYEESVPCACATSKPRPRKNAAVRATMEDQAGRNRHDSRH